MSYINIQALNVLVRLNTSVQHSVIVLLQNLTDNQQAAPMTGPLGRLAGVYAAALCLLCDGIFDGIGYRLPVTGDLHLHHTLGDLGRFLDGVVQQDA